MKDKCIWFIRQCGQRIKKIDCNLVAFQQLRHICQVMFNSSLVLEIHLYMFQLAWTHSSQEHCLVTVSNAWATSSTINSSQIKTSKEPKHKHSKGGFQSHTHPDAGSPTALKWSAGNFHLTRLPSAPNSWTNTLPRGMMNTTPEGKVSTAQNTKYYSPWESH